MRRMMTLKQARSYDVAKVAHDAIIQLEDAAKEHQKTIEELEQLLEKVKKGKRNGRRT